MREPARVANNNIEKPPIHIMVSRYLDIYIE